MLAFVSNHILDSLICECCAQINLSNNDIGGYYDNQQQRTINTSEGPKAIADAICVSASLTSINLGCNHLGPEGAKYIAEGISVSASLTSINLMGN